MKKRVVWIDIVKGIGIWLVIFNHISLSLGQESVKYAIASFHMPLFFIAAGLTMNAERLSVGALWRYIIKRFLAIMVPYYIWVLIFSYGISAKSLLLMLYGNNYSLSVMGGSPALWFLPCMFVSSVLTRLMLSWTAAGRPKWDCIVLPALTAANFAVGAVLTEFAGLFQYGWPMGLNIAFVGNGFILFGHMLGRIANRVTAGDGLSLTVRTLVKGILLFTVCIALTFLFADRNRQAAENPYGRVVMALSAWGNLPLFVCSGLTGTVGVSVLARILEKTAIGQKWLADVGKQTMIILATHNSILDVCVKLAMKCGMDRFGWITVVLISLVTLTVSYALAVILKAAAPSLACGNLKVLDNVREKEDLVGRG